MSENRQRIFAPVLVLLLLLIAWEGLVTLLRIEQALGAGARYAGRGAFVSLAR